MGNNSLVLEHLDSVPTDLEEILLEGISDHARQERGLGPMYPFGIFIKNKQDQILGGLTGVTFYGSLYIDSLWVDKTIRSQGWGTKLMREAEMLGKKHGARFITLNTMDWEGLLFYQKLGFAIEFTREGYEKNSKMYLLRKNL